jgi:hypothetical protein
MYIHGFIRIASQERKTADEAQLKKVRAKIDELALENDFLAKALGR